MQIWRVGADEFIIFRRVYRIIEKNIFFVNITFIAIKTYKFFTFIIFSPI